MFDVFYKTKELVLDEKFQEEFFEEYFSTYPRDEQVTADENYPSIFVDFDLNNDGEYDYQFHSMYYKQPYKSGEKNEIDGYKTWTYWDFKSDSKPVPDKNEKE